MLGWVHASGWVHGAILPRHLLVHPRDHGVVFAGWSCAVPIASREPVPAIVDAERDVYPEGSTRAPVDPTFDLTMSGRVIAKALGGSCDDVPPGVPRPIAELVRAVARGAWSDDAWTLKSRVGEAAGEAYGPPKYHRLEMPGWR
jgi:hypothetical protein